jgi:hypothetical protein
VVAVIGKHRVITGKPQDASEYLPHRWLVVNHQDFRWGFDHQPTVAAARVPRNRVVS